MPANGSNATSRLSREINANCVWIRSARRAAWHRRHVIPSNINTGERAVKQGLKQLFVKLCYGRVDASCSSVRNNRWQSNRWQLKEVSLANHRVKRISLSVRMTSFNKLG